MTQRTLFSGPDVTPADAERLSGQLGAVREIMADGKWRTFKQIGYGIYAKYGLIASEASISARLRDLRKPKFGQHVVERQRVGKGLFKYRVKE